MEEQSISLERHSRKDKFHLIRVPKGFDIKKLDGVTYDPEQILEIETKQDGSGLVTSFELGAFSSQSMDLNLLVKSEDKIKIGPSIQKNFFVKRTVNIDQNETHFAVAGLRSAPSGSVHLPTGLKERFTPFGRDCPPSPRKGSPSKKEKKSKRSIEITSFPTKQPQRNYREGDDIKVDSASYNNSIGEFGDAELALMENASTDKMKKHKKKKRKRKSSADESECKVNGDSGLFDVSITSGINELDSTSLVNESGDIGMVKSHKRKRKHSSSDEAVHVDRDGSIHPTSDESIVKEKRHKERKKKEDKIS